MGQTENAQTGHSLLSLSVLDATIIRDNLSIKVEKGRLVSDDKKSKKRQTYLVSILLRSLYYLYLILNVYLCSFGHVRQLLPSPGLKKITRHASNKAYLINTVALHPRYSHLAFLTTGRLDMSYLRHFHAHTSARRWALL